jgi:hypothetical protein
MAYKARSASSGLFGWARAWFATLLLVLAMASVATAASAAAYIGDGITDLKPEDKVVIASPQPVQLIFQFQTKGAPNARATKLLKQKVVDTVKASGLFSTVSDDAVPNGAILSITINDIASPADMADAEGKGAVTGATFFVVGSNIADHYLCTLDYVGSPTAPKIERTAHHSVIIQMGMINKPPEHAVKIGSANDAVFTMVSQIVANPLNDVAKDPGFSGAAAAPAPPAATTPADTTAAAPTAAEAPAATTSTSAPGGQPK